MTTIQLQTTAHGEAWASVLTDAKFADVLRAARTALADARIGDDVRRALAATTARVCFTEIDGQLAILLYPKNQPPA